MTASRNFRRCSILEGTTSLRKMEASKRRGVDLGALKYIPPLDMIKK